MNIFEVCRTFESAPESSLPDNVSASTEFYRENFRVVFLENHAVYSHDESDDIIFYIKTVDKEKPGPLLTVARRDTLCPLTETEVDWHATFYANLVLHSLEFTMVCAVGVGDKNNLFKALHKCTKRVYPNPSQARMDKKGKSTTICYPHIYFSVEDYERTFSDIHVGPQHKLAVEIVASNAKFDVRKSVFSGMVEYALLRNAVDRAVSSRSSLLKRIWSFNTHTRSPYEFVKMNGPKGKGHAEVAIGMEAVEDLHSALSGPKIEAASKVPLNCHVTYVEQHVESLVNDILRGTKSPILIP